MYKLKLIKGLSYTGAVHATRDNPYVDVESKEAADAVVATGYFELVEEAAEEKAGGETNENADITKMTVKQLKAYAEEMGIDLAGANRQAEIIAKIKEAAEEKAGGEADYGEDE